jgi:ammonia channel protein AmtB
MASRRVIVAGSFAAVVIIGVPISALAASLSSVPISPLIPHLLTWLLPLGITLVAMGMQNPTQYAQITTAMPLALACAVIGYWFCGFAFHYGGVGLVGYLPGRELVLEWSPFDLALGPGWGLLGLKGFAPSGAQDWFPLLSSQLGLVTTAALLPLLALGERMPKWAAALLALFVACISFPLVGNWIRGGGWLSHLGETLSLGRGFLDYGLSSYFLVGANTAFAALLYWGRLPRKHPATTAPLVPPAYLPIIILLGVVSALIGWQAAILAQPIVPQSLQMGVIILNSLLAVAAAGLVTLFLSWLAKGHFDAGLVGRGFIAGMLAVGASVSLASSWMALAIGAVAGILIVPGAYLVEKLLRLDDRAAILSVYGLASTLSLLAVAFVGQQKPGPAGQLFAQLLGTAGIGVISFILPGVILGFFALLGTRGYALRDSWLAQNERRKTLRRERIMLHHRQKPPTLFQALYATYLHQSTVAVRSLVRRKTLTKKHKVIKPTSVSLGHHLSRHR